MTDRDFAERAIEALERMALAQERTADLVEIMLGVASGAIEIEPDEEPEQFPEHQTEQ